MNSLVQTIQHLFSLYSICSVANRRDNFLLEELLLLCLVELFSLVPFADFLVPGYERILTISEIGHRKRARTSL